MSIRSIWLLNETKKGGQRWGSTHQMSRKGHWTFWTQNFGLVVKWAEPNLENTRLYIFKPFPLQKIIKFLIIAIALCAKAKATLISRHFLDNSNTRKEDLTLPKSNAQKKINQFQNLHYISDCNHHVQSKKFLLWKKNFLEALAELLKTATESRKKMV